MKKSILLLAIVLLISNLFWWGCKNPSIIEPESKQKLELNRDLLKSNDDIITDFLSKCEKKIGRNVKINEKKNLIKLLQAFNKVNDNNKQKVKVGNFIKYALVIPTSDIIDKLNTVDDNDINVTYEKILTLPALILKDNITLSKITAPDQGDNKSGSLSAHKILVDAENGVVIFNADINSIYFYSSLSHKQTGFVPSLSWSLWQSNTSVTKENEEHSVNGSTVVFHSATFQVSWYLDLSLFRIPYGSDGVSISAYQDLNQLNN